MSFSRYVVTRQSRTDVPGLPEATSVEYVNGTAQGVTRQFVCRGLVAQELYDYSPGWLLPRLSAVKQAGAAVII